MDGDTQDEQTPGRSIVHEEVVSSDRFRVSFGRHELALLPDESGMVGYLARWDVVTDRGTFFKKSAFARTINAYPARPHLWQHWPDLIIGVNKEPIEDRTGLKIKAVLNESDELGARAMGVYRFGQTHGWVPDWSIGFDRIQDRTAKEEELSKLDFSGAGPFANAPYTELRAITEAAWFEGSTVTWGAIHNAGPDVIHSRHAAYGVDLAALTIAFREGRLSPDQLSQIDALIAARQASPGPGESHSTPPAPSQAQFAAQLDILFLELGVPTEQAA